MSRTPKAGEQGYALIAAVASILLFAAVALTIEVASRVEITTGSAEIARARASLAADAGLAMALHGLVAGDPETLAQLDGRNRRIDFAGARITLHIEDERGKVALNHIGEPAAERMLRAVGVEGTALDVARDSLLDWLDSDDEPRPNGAEAPDYAAQGIAPRNGDLRSIDELARVRGFSAQLVARLRPFVTVDNDAIPFDPDHAKPLALAAMSEAGSGSPQTIERQREAAGQHVALSFTDSKPLIGRPLTIAIDAEAPGGGHTQRVAVVELTGLAMHPYVIHTIR